MRIQPEEIERLIGKILLEWKTQKLVNFTEPEGKVRVHMLDTFAKELKVEEELEKEVEAMLAKYEKQFENGTLDRHKMFRMVKAQLAKEKKVIL